jgi:hypothetical protein
VSIADSATQQYEITQRISERRSDLLTKSSKAATEGQHHAAQSGYYPRLQSGGRDVVSRTRLMLPHFMSLACSAPTLNNMLI